jgi:hypothetical protein
MIQVKVKSNFSFSKLADNINKVFDETLKAAAKDSEEKTKFNIDKSITPTGIPMKRLNDATLSARSRGIYWEGNSKTERQGNATKVTPDGKKGLRNKFKDKPLKYTGKLYDSIKAKDKKLSMVRYGKKQNDGYSVSGNSADWIVPKRPFIEKLAGKKAIKTFNEQIKKNLIK